jgi:hypothetical protein
VVPRGERADHILDLVYHDRPLKGQSERLRSDLGARLHLADPIGERDGVQPAKQAGDAQQQSSNRAADAYRRTGQKPPGEDLPRPHRRIRSKHLRKQKPRWLPEVMGNL